MEHNCERFEDFNFTHSYIQKMGADPAAPASEFFPDDYTDDDPKEGRAPHLVWHVTNLATSCPEEIPQTLDRIRDVLSVRESEEQAAEAEWSRHLAGLMTEAKREEAARALGMVDPLLEAFPSLAHIVRTVPMAKLAIKMNSIRENHNPNGSKIASRFKDDGDFDVVFQKLCDVFGFDAIKEERRRHRWEGLQEIIHVYSRQTWCHRKRHT